MSLIQHQKNIRSGLVNRLYRELIGPSDEDPESQQREELEVSPLSLYGAGILFPQKALQDQLEDASRAEPESFDQQAKDDVPELTELDTGTRSATLSSDTEKEDAVLNLANEFSPSAMGITFRTSGSDKLVVRVSGGRYTAVRKNIPHPKAGQLRRDGSVYSDTYKKTSYRRMRISKDIPISLSTKAVAVKKIPLRELDGRLSLHLTTRAKSDASIVVSLMAVNENQCAPDAFPDPEEAFFQVCLSVRSAEGKHIFESVDRPIGNSPKGEQESLELQYRHRRSFALGHGCAGDWDRSPEIERSGLTSCVKTATLPTYEVLPIRPREVPFKQAGVNLSMSFLAGNNAEADDFAKASIIASLRALTDDYSAWVEDQENQLNEISEPLKEVGLLHIEKCKACLKRMRQGIDVLAHDDKAFLAFRLANQAMLMQQFHYSWLKSRVAGSPMPVIPDRYLDLPGPVRKWRPFQLAFFIMNLAGTCDNSHDDRKIVDLIWFPTGGGKTEAYLGLAAFSICLRRIRSKEDAGTTVLMRYTLRLLTAQQFERASALILALDVLRQDQAFGAELGDEPITIGLWVGQSLSPNTRSEALQALKQLRKPNSYAKNPFQLLECPWCKMRLDDRSNLGYSQERVRAGASAKTVVFRCPDHDCRWGGSEVKLPIFVVDEDMYEQPPTVLIGTVDKFAQIAWSDKVGRFFGIDTNFNPPTLIIQDELHLISGPLGSIVGLYETAIERLIGRNGVKPKIVASTATIRSAGEQCKSLYNREYFDFPPAGLVAGESYFAYEDKSAPGRLYVGVFGSGLKSHATAQVRTCSALLQEVMAPYTEGAADESVIKDPYGTIVWYFNSLRELGYALTLCTGDIPEYIKGLCRRLAIPPERRRQVRQVVELTSRRTADEIPRILQSLGKQWLPNPAGQYPVDILLATNMISVGVDVSRLGLMVVTGQPKTTSEYIQATSRVGRAHPGLVITVYNQSKSRDRSHFERFNAYHQALYKFVEPTSVTPFAAPARDRGLRALLIALARLSAGVSSPDQVQEKRDRLLIEVEAILDRVEAIDCAERDEAEEELESALRAWCSLLPSEYGRMGGQPSTTTLAYPFGSSPHPIFQEKAWPIMTSMRNVDQTCEARVVSTYDGNEPQAQEDN